MTQLFVEPLAQELRGTSASLSSTPDDIVLSKLSRNLEKDREDVAENAETLLLLIFPVAQQLLKVRVHLSRDFFF